MSPEKYFTKEQQQAIVAAIQEAEKNTSGEIRLHVDSRSKKDTLDRATEVFADLKMHRTAERNGVLIYLSIEDKKLAILGDAGINAKVPAGFWDCIRNNMVEKFKAGQITEGICEAIIEAGLQLKQYFPHRKDDKNELPDDISFGKKE